MDGSLLRRAVVVAVGTLFFGMLSTRADEVPTLSDVHKTLLQAAGFQADTPPTVDQQIQLLTQASDMIRKVPHVYHGQLKAASRLIEAALDELQHGDPAHKAREEIFSADDEIKALI